MNCQGFKDIALLRHPANADGSALMRMQFVKRLPRKLNLTCMLLGGASQGVKQGGFTRAISTQQCQRLTFCQLKVDVLQYNRFAITR